jgi:drug/metabolite transporter (DMT)-like permease
MVRAMSTSGFTTALFRMWIGAPVMILVARVLGRPLTRRVFRLTLLPGVFFGGSMAMGFQAVHFTSIANATLIGSLTPALLLLGANRLLGERVDLRRVPYAVLAILGLVVLVMAGSNNEGAGITGDLWAMGNLLCFTAYFMLLKRRRDDNVDGWSFLAGVFLTGAVVITPACLILSDDIGWLVGFDWLRITIMVLGPGVIGHGLITWASRHLPVTTVSLLTLLSPVLTVIGAWIVYDESLVVGQFVGAAMVLGGLVGSVRGGDAGREPVVEHP